ncbi:MAG: cobalt transporter CbiM [Desulfovibrionaceae bacterium]
MHIAEGVLPWPVLAAGGVLTAAGTAVGLKKIDYDQIMSVSMLSAAFFVGSLIHVPVLGSSAHLVLGGLLGIILGWAAFPAILVALLLQAVLFQFGGLTTLGVNTFNMAAPAVLCFYLFRPLLSSSSPGVRSASAFAFGFLALLLSALLTAASLISVEGFLPAATALVISHVAIMIVEGLITMFAYGFLAKVKPEVLAGVP